MGTPILQEIRELTINLPKKDIDLANKFIADRKFDDLKDLVDSAIYKIKKNLKTDNPKEEYVLLDIGELERLQNQVWLYCSYQDIEDLQNEDDSDEFLDENVDIYDDLEW